MQRLSDAQVGELEEHLRITLREGLDPTTPPHEDDGLIHTLRVIVEGWIDRAFESEGRAGT